MEDKKETIYFNDDDSEIIHPNYRPMFQSVNSGSYPEMEDDKPIEEFRESDFTIVYAFTSAIVALFIILLFILKFFL